MTPKNFVYLAAAAAASVLLAVVSFAANNQWSTGESAGEKLLPGFSAREVAEIEVRQGDNTVVLEKKQGGTWFMKNRDGYPADTSKVRPLLLALAEADLIESKTSKVDRYAALELEDPAGKSAKSRLVKLTGTKGNTIAEVVIGKQRAAAYGAGKEAGTYVRKVGDVQTWLADVEVSASVAVKDWVKTTFLTLESEKISRIGIEIPGEQALKIERPAPPAAKEKDSKDAKGKKEAAKDAKEPTKDAKELTKDAKETKETEETKAPPPAKLAFVAFPPEGKKLKDAAAAETLARAVSSIDLEDVRKLAAPPSGEGVGTVKIELKDGATATLRLRKDGDAHWLSIVATGEGEAAKKAAEEIGARTKDWEFRIPAFKAEAILKKRSDLLEAPKEGS
jgi:uncharacterized protein DUF4340